MTEQLALSDPPGKIYSCAWNAEDSRLTFFVANGIDALETVRVRVPRFAGINAPVVGVSSKAGFKVSTNAINGPVPELDVNSVQLMGTFTSATLEIEDYAGLKFGIRSNSG